MSHFNITKKSIGIGRLLLSEDKEILSNGAWAVKRNLVKQAALLTSVEAMQALFPRATCAELKDSTAKAVVPHYQDPITFRKTPWIKVISGFQEGVLFVGEDGKSQMWIDRKYVETFNLEDFKAPACPGEAGLNAGMVPDGEDDWCILVMPLREDYQEGLK